MMLAYGFALDRITGHIDSSRRSKSSHTRARRLWVRCSEVSPQSQSLRSLTIWLVIPTYAGSPFPKSIVSSCLRLPFSNCATTSDLWRCFEGNFALGSMRHRIDLVRDSLGIRSAKRNAWLGSYSALKRQGSVSRRTMIFGCVSL